MAKMNNLSLELEELRKGTNKLSEILIYSKQHYNIN